MIKKIQLRGISRTPSDRMTADGGCAESLNVHLDDQELAPTLPPNDVTTDICPSENAEYPIVYIHRGGDYVNYITYRAGQQGLIGYYKDREHTHIVTLDVDEEFNSVSNVGNTLIVSTTKRFLYALFADNAYKLLGDKLPIPKISFYSEYDNTYVNGQSGLGYTAYIGTDTTLVPDTESQAKYTNYLLNRKNAGESGVLGSYDETISSLWSLYTGQERRFAGRGELNAPVFMRFAVRLYDGKVINASVPVMLGTKCDLIQFTGMLEQNTTNRYIGFRNVFSDHSHYRPKIKFEGWLLSSAGSNVTIDDWSDIIKSADVFMSKRFRIPVGNPLAEVSAVTSDWGLDNFDDRIGGLTFYQRKFRFLIETEKDFKNSLLMDASSAYFKIMSIGTNDEAKTVGVDVRYLYEDNLLAQESLTEDYLSEQTIAAEQVSNINGRLLASGLTRFVPPGYRSLNGAVCNTNDWVTTEFYFEFIYRLKINGETLYVPGRSYANNNEISLYCEYEGDDGYVDGYSWLAFPDSRCDGVYVRKNGTGRVALFKMEPHPFVNCSFAFWGTGFLQDTLSYMVAYGGTYNESDKTWEQLEALIKTSYRDDKTIMLSEALNPFLFDPTNYSTFLSDVIATAMAAAPMSEGQFGQYPLYVFTRDGIFAMQMDDEGVFKSSRIVSREVALPGTVLPLEQSVVFVTDKGLMLIAGSQVTNLSPNMNGRHFALDPQSSEYALISGGSWGSLAPILEDSTTFMAFMKEARIAYDYIGERLICINNAESYAYVYMLKTATWHKIPMDANVAVNVLNSYPDCLVGKQVLSGYGCSVTITATRGTGQQNMPLAWHLVYFGFYDNPNSALAALGTGLPLTLGKVFTAEERLNFLSGLDEYGAIYTEASIPSYGFKVLNFSTVIDDAALLSDEAEPVKGIIITRPFDLGEPDVRKTIKEIRIRGQFNRNDVRYILLGSFDDIHWQRLTSLRGGSYKLFRMIILTNLSPTERISWVDVDYESRFTNKLR